MIRGKGNPSDPRFVRSVQVYLSGFRFFDGFSLTRGQGQH